MGLSRWRPVGGLRLRGATDDGPHPPLPSTRRGLHGWRPGHIDPQVGENCVKDTKEEAQNIFLFYSTWQKFASESAYVRVNSLNARVLFKYRQVRLRNCDTSMSLWVCPSVPVSVRSGGVDRSATRRFASLTYFGEVLLGLHINASSLWRKCTSHQTTYTWK